MTASIPELLILLRIIKCTSSICCDKSIRTCLLIYSLYHKELFSLWEALLILRTGDIEKITCFTSQMLIIWEKEVKIFSSSLKCIKKVLKTRLISIVSKPIKFFSWWKFDQKMYLIAKTSNWSKLMVKIAVFLVYLFSI